MKVTEWLTAHFKNLINIGKIEEIEEYCVIWKKWKNFPFFGATWI